MIKQTFLLVLLSAGLFFITSAQVFVMDLPPGYNKVISSEKEQGLDGSPWLTEDWIPGTIKLNSGKTIEGLTYRYNVYRNRLYFQYENAEYVVGSPDSINHLLLDGRKFVFANSDPADQYKKRFLEVAVEGNACLYINYYPFMIPSNYNIALGAGNPNETVSVKESYLIKIGSNLTVVDRKGKLLPVVFADRSQEIKSFIKKERISGQKRSDLEKVVRYYNSLKN